MRIEAKDQGEKLQMADGTLVKTEGPVQFTPKCDGYRGMISAQVFPNINKLIVTFIYNEVVLSLQ